MREQCVQIPPLNGPSDKANKSSVEHIPSVHIAQSVD